LRPRRAEKRSAFRHSSRHRPPHSIFPECPIIAAIGCPVGPISPSIRLDGDRCGARRTRGKAVAPDWRKTLRFSALRLLRERAGVLAFGGIVGRKSAAPSASHLMRDRRMASFLNARLSPQSGSRRDLFSIHPIGCDRRGAPPYQGKGASTGPAEGATLFRPTLA